MSKNLRHSRPFIRHSREGGSPALRASARTKTHVVADAALSLDRTLRAHFVPRLRGNDSFKGGNDDVAVDAAS
jgi:hypothetical protein